MDDVDGVQLFHHGQDAGSQVHNKRLRHQLLTQAFVDVHCILGAESKSQNTRSKQCDVRTFLHTFHVEVRKRSVINVTYEQIPTSRVP